MAMTLKYVTVTGAGAKNGTDAANAWDWPTMLSSAVAGDDVLVQEGTYARTNFSSFSNNGTSTSPIRVRGAKTDWTPLSPTRTNAGELSTTNMPVIAFNDSQRVNMGTWTILSCLKISSKAGSGGVVEMASNSLLHSCVVENNGTDADANCVACAVSSIVYGCDLTHTGASGAGYGVTTSTNCKILQNRINCGTKTSVGVNVTSNGVVIADNVIFTRGNGISCVDVSVAVLNNTIILLSGSTSDGIVIASGSTLACMIGNLITDATKYGINGSSAANGMVSIGNRIDRTTSGAYNSATDWLASTKFGDDVTSVSQANEYEDASSNDYRLKSTSPAIGKGPWLLGDIGALQADGGGGGYTYGDEDAAKVLTTATGAGTYQPVAASDVRSGVDVGVAPTEGTLVLPAESDVADGVDYGHSAEFTGTYDPLAAAVFPAAANVSTVETAYGPTGAEYAGELDLSLYALISAIVWPDLDEVDEGVTFGPVTGLEYEGTGMNLTTLQGELDTRFGTGTPQVDAIKAAGRTVGDVGEGNTAHLLQSADTGETAVARPGDEMDLVDKPNETAVDAIQEGLSTYDGSDTPGVGSILEIVDSETHGNAALLTAIKEIEAGGDATAENQVAIALLARKILVATGGVSSGVGTPLEVYEHDNLRMTTTLDEDGNRESVEFEEVT